MLSQFITGYTRHRSRISEVKPDALTMIRVPRLVYHLLYKVGAGSLDDLTYYHDVVFGWWARRRLRECRLFHGFSSYSLECMQVAGSRGAVLIWEGGCHPRAYQEVYSRESALAGIRLPPDFRENSSKRMEREIAMADAIIVTSESARSTYLSRGISESKLHVVRLGWEPSVFAGGSKKQKTDEVRLLFVGGVSLFKGMRYLLDAFVKLRGRYGSRVTLDIVGGLDRNASSLMRNLPEGVFLRGRKRQEELKECYSAADIFVFPSLIEGSAMVVYEAMGSGLPVVTTRMAGSVVRDGIDGFVVTPADSGQLAEKVAVLIDDSDLRERMGTSAKKWAMEFTWDAYRARFLTEVEKIYQKATAERVRH
jgi:glycosyltransferase involved in cell wall biosynthesis